MFIYIYLENLKLYKQDNTQFSSGANSNLKNKIKSILGLGFQWQFQGKTCKPSIQKP